MPTSQTYVIKESSLHFVRTTKDGTVVVYKSTDIKTPVATIPQSSAGPTKLTIELAAGHHGEVLLQQLWWDDGCVPYILTVLGQHVDPRAAILMPTYNNGGMPPCEDLEVRVHPNGTVEFEGEKGQTSGEFNADKLFKSRAANDQIMLLAVVVTGANQGTVLIETP